eukprot:GEMP01023962.1.p1 GENE.GEMP01023962.1~~GEMP01023962.1.p1  ORF type:complete len:357 (+),score=51.75 GEMP01023962.1:286-1356(+)
MAAQRNNELHAALRGVGAVEETLVNLLQAYAANGVENVRKGCIVVVGSRELLRAHPPLFTSDFEESSESYSLLDDRLACFGTAYQSIRRRLNEDGMVFVDGTSGLLIATKLYSRHISDNAPRSGSRTKSALGVSESAANLVILKVSEDGDICRIEGGNMTVIENRFCIGAWLSNKIYDMLRTHMICFALGGMVCLVFALSDSYFFSHTPARTAPRFQGPPFPEAVSINFSPFNGFAAICTGKLVTKGFNRFPRADGPHSAIYEHDVTSLCCPRYSSFLVKVQDYYFIELYHSDSSRQRWVRELDDFVFLDRASPLSGDDMKRAMTNGSWTPMVYRTLDPTANGWSTPIVYKTHMEP